MSPKFGKASSINEGHCQLVWKKPLFSPKLDLAVCFSLLFQLIHLHSSLTPLTSRTPLCHTRLRPRWETNILLPVLLILVSAHLPLTFCIAAVCLPKEPLLPVHIHLGLRVLVQTQDPTNSSMSPPLSLSLQPISIPLWPLPTSRKALCLYKECCSHHVSLGLRDPTVTILG